MIEVFKTNVEDSLHARMLTDEIHARFNGYAANFDLDDCDRILRVQSAAGTIQSRRLVELLRRFGFEATVLADDAPDKIERNNISGKPADMTDTKSEIKTSR